MYRDSVQMKISLNFKKTLTVNILHFMTKMQVKKFRA